MIAGQNIAPAADNPFRDKIVLVGGTFRAGRDIVLTPKGMMSGVEVQANILNTLLTDSHIRTPHWSVNFALQVVLSVTFGLIFFLFRSRTAMLLSLCLVFLVLIPASYYLFLLRHYWIDFIIPVIAVKLTGSVIDHSDRKRIRSAFSSYVSREVMQCVYNDAALLEGQRTALSVLFADIRGFTALSETLPPEQLSTLLNEYYAFMTDAVVRNNGVVNKFIGDAILAIYGAPVPREDHAEAAVKTAKAMLAGMAQLNARLARHELPPIAIGIGVHTGPAFAGNIGTAERREYAVAGDTVNTASRLEGMNKDLGTACLISDATLQQLGRRPAVRDMGEITIRGRRQPLRVYALAPEQEE
jgi:adenylate cyclase